MLGGGSRISHHLRDCNHHHLGLGFCSTGIVKLSSFIFRPSNLTIIGDNHSNRQRFQQRLVSSSSLQCKSPGEIPIAFDCFSQQEDDHEPPSEGLSAVAGGIVALGKFDALHIGHRELAIQASKVGTPYLLSFVGIAEVLGWEPRAPIVAKCDRSRVLASWASYCSNVAPSEFQIEFSSVRHLNPQQFVEKLSKELRVCGVVAGENYRFGYKAAGDATDLVRLCEEYGIGAYIINSVMDRSKDPKNMDIKDRGQVSSTRVRHALAIGNMKYVSELLGRRHRLVLMIKDQKGFTRSNNGRWKISASKSCLLNLAPKNGLYENCFVMFDNENSVRCDVFIDSNCIHLEIDDLGLNSDLICQDLNILGVEFGD
ncbi:FAD synthetase 2, chloroplastic-like [Euphorbia lathyris]|uniref:FAD synthetase 2, chloroplastic-like n=1 Tax=Euphorbia lathyris TaxID=212925 RepID=UPI0033135EB6